MVLAARAWGMADSVQSFEVGGCRLFCADWRNVRREFSQAAAVVSDPPYGVAYRSQRRVKPRRVGGTVIHEREWAPIVGDDKEFDPRPWIRFPKVVLFGANHYAHRLPPSASWLIWDKRDGVAIDDNADCELAWTNLPGVARVHRQLWKGVCRAGEENISRSGRKLHPAQKPVALMAYCLELCRLSAGDVVVDPFMGSGSTGVAAVRAGYRFVGVEIDQAYFDIACSRLEKTIGELEGRHDC